MASKKITKEASLTYAIFIDKKNQLWVCYKLSFVLH